MPSEQEQNLGMAPARNDKLQLIIMVVVCVLFGVFLLWGLMSGLAYGRSVITYQHVDQIRQALDSFHKDEGKYPTQTQFFEQRILTVQGYLNTLPGPASPSGACKAYQDFQYSQSNQQNYSLVFCLEKSVKGVSAGVHNLTNQGLAQ